MTSDRSEKAVRTDRRQTEKEIQETRQKIRLNTRETNQKLNQLNLVEGEIDKCNGRIAVISSRLDSINGRMKNVSDSIDALDSNLKRISSSYIKAVRRQQGRRQQTGALAFIFSSDSFQQAWRRARYLHQFNKWREKRTREIEVARKALDEKKQRLQELGAVAASSKNQLAQERSGLVKRQAQTKALVAELQSQGSELQQIMADQKARAAALERELDAVIARETARREAEQRARAEAERKKAEAEAEARRIREEEAARAAAEKAAAEEAARKAEEAARAEQARKEAEELAKKKAAEAAWKEKEAAKARKEAKKQAEREEAQRKAAEAEAAKQAAREAEKARKEAEAQAKKAAKEQKAAEERKTREEARRKAHAVKRQRKPSTAPAPSESEGSGSAGTLHTPAASSKAGTSSASVETGSQFADMRGRLSFPVAGSYTIVRRFGRQTHPSLPHVQTDNAGVDIQTTRNAGVRAVFDGEVSAVFRPDGYNSVVVVRHGQYLTVYANLDHVSVSTGQKVKAGQNLGTVFSDPNDDGRSVLHFEVRNGRAKENPESWLK